MLLILFWISFLIFNFSYLFRVFFLVFLIMFFMLIYIRRMIYLKFLIILVYVRGVVVFILYISCMCWFSEIKFSFIFLFFSSFVFVLFDLGIFIKFSDIGEFIWIYLFLSLLFNSLVTSYSLNLFKNRGSLRF